MMKTTEDRLTYKAPALKSHQRHSGFVQLSGYRADALMRTRGLAHPCSAKAAYPAFEVDLKV